MRVAWLTLMVCLVSTMIIGAENPFLGTWKLNTAESKYRPGPAPEGEIMTFAQEGDSMRRTVKGAKDQGDPIVQGGHESVSFVWDGKDHRVSQRPAAVMSVTVYRLNTRTTYWMVKREGKVVYREYVTVSKDGRMITSKEKGTSGKRAKVDIVATFYKQ